MSETDISLEPLFNQSSEGAGADKKIAFVPVNTVGVATERAEVSSSSTRVEITITAGHRTLELHNADSAQILYYGGSTVTSARGIPLFPKQTKTFANVKDDFSIYVVADGSESPEYRIVEYS